MLGSIGKEKNKTYKVTWREVREYNCSVTFEARSEDEALTFAEAGLIASDNESFYVLEEKDFKAYEVKED
jgi:hypothetical protein